MLRSTFSTTTIASSTTMPIASTRPNSVSRLIEKPSASMPANVATSDDDDRHRADDRRAEALQEQVDDQHHQHDRLEQRLDHLLDRQPHEVVGVERDDVVDALREARLHLLQRLAHRLRDDEPVGARLLVDGDERRRRAVQLGVDDVLAQAHLGARDVAQRARSRCRPGSRAG